MKKVLIGMSFILMLIGSANAAVYTFSPTPNDMGDLDHLLNFTWGINWSVPTGERIVSASLFIDDLNNNAEPEDSDQLYIHLLNDPRLGARGWQEIDPAGDDFSGRGILLMTYSDPNLIPEDVSYVFTDDQIFSLTHYASTKASNLYAPLYGTFGFGFDPDCHFVNNGITLTVATEKSPVPEPATMSLLGMGVLGLFGLKRKKA